MELPQYKIWATDLSEHALLAIHCPSCRILTQIPYPDNIFPIHIAATRDGKKAFIPANDPDKGYLLVLNLASDSLYQLPVDMPLIRQFALSPNDSLAYVVSQDNTLYCFDIAALSLTACGNPGILANCTGIAVSDDCLYTIWEDPQGGSLLRFDLSGQLIREYTFSAIPTSITVAPPNTILVTFTASEDAGEGIFLLDEKAIDEQEPIVITTLCPQDLISHQNYPIHAALSSDGALAYIVNEDSASISILDMNKRTVTGHIIVGRAISRLYLLPDSPFAVATSSLFADMILIDLINRQVLSTTMPSKELSPHIALVIG